ncbi:ABC transporter substrate-binding protein [Paenibacillus sp. GXUN7292]|uniref:ABC transporter substrate-binding protein n=1 Tax=Paenibacillus sp. GXUN7292 TaxID=3422499 RepID=UPI003D7DDD64
MQVRKFAPLVIGALLIIALLLIPSSRSIKWSRGVDQMHHLPALPIQGQITAEQPVDLFVNVSLTSEEFEQLRLMNEQFMKYTRGINVYLSNDNSSEYAYERWSEQHALGKTADIMLLDNSWVRQFAIQGYLKPVDSIMAGDVLADQLPAVLDALRWNGYLWGVPRMLNPNILLWNKALLTELGWTEPPSNWKEWVEAADSLDAAADQPLFAVELDDFTQLLPLLGKFESEEDNVLHLKTWSSRQYEQINDLRQFEAHNLLLQTSDRKEVGQAFANGHLLAAVLPWNEYMYLNSSVKEQLIVDEESIIYPWLNGQSFVISSRTKHDKEAMKWIQALTDLSHQQQLHESFRFLPTTVTALQEMDYWEQDKFSREFDWLNRLNQKPAEHKSSRLDPQWLIYWEDWQQRWLEDADALLHSISAYNKQQKEAAS